MAAYYIQANVFCLLLLVYLTFTLRNKKEFLSSQRVAFNRVAYSTIVMCISDLFAWLYLGTDRPYARLILLLSNMVYDAAITCTCCAWFCYVYHNLHPLEGINSRFDMLASIPLAVMLLIIAVNPLTNFLFIIDDANNYSRSAGLVVHWIISWGYMFGAEILVLMHYKKPLPFAVKKRLPSLLAFVVPPAIAAIFQMLVYGVSALQCGSTVSIIVIAFSYLQDKVLQDSLTGINNRNALDQYISNALTRGTQKISVLMCDVDKFKSINDTLGHVVGDIALKDMSCVLKNSIAQFHESIFLCRYGGDEFILCGTDLSEGVLDLVKNAIRNALNEYNLQSTNKFTLDISMGTATAQCGTPVEMEKLIAQADHEMYEDKVRKKCK